MYYINILNIDQLDISWNGVVDSGGPLSKTVLRILQADLRQLPNFLRSYLLSS